MTSKTSQNPTLSPEIIRLGHQLRAFFQQDIRRPHLDVQQLVKTFVEQNPLPSDLEGSQEDTGLHRTRSQSAAGDVPEPRTFPSDWVIDRSAYNEAVNAFVAAVRPSSQRSRSRRHDNTSSNERGRPPTGPERQNEPIRPTGDSMSHNDTTSNLGGSSSSTGNNMPPPPPPLSGFTTDQQDWIEQLVSRSIRGAVAAIATPQQGIGRERPFDGLSNSRDGGSTPNTVRDDGPTQFKPEVVGYFHPDLPATYGKDDIVYSGKETIYRDVHAFVDRLQDMLPVYGALAIRTNLVKCLRGRASAWYTTQLTPLEKEGLRNGDGITLWTNALVHKFRESATVALTRLNSVKYTTSDARQKHEPADYIYEVVRRAKAAGFDQTIQQLTYAYNGLEPELRALIDEPRDDTTIDGFIDAIERKKHAWFDVYSVRSMQRGPMDRRATVSLDPNRRGFTTGPSHGYTSRPSYASEGNRGQYRFNTPYNTSYNVPYRPYNGDRPYDGNTGRNVQQSIEQAPYNEANRYQSRTPHNASFNSTPWNQRRSDFPRGPSQTPGFQQRRLGTPGQRGSPGSPVKQEDELRRTPFRTRAYHANEQEIHHSEQPTYGQDTSYDAYEEGFFEGQNAAYWTQQAREEEIHESEPFENNNTSDKEPNSEGMEHTDAHIAAIKDICCRICKTPFPSRTKLHNHLKMSNCLKAEARISGSIYENGQNLRPQAKDNHLRARLDDPNHPKLNSNNSDLHSTNLKTHNLYNHSKDTSHCLHLSSRPNDETTQQGAVDRAVTVVSSVADGLKGDGYGFRGWHYATIGVKFTIAGPLHAICMDTGCTMSLIDRNFLSKEIPGAAIQRMASSISVRGLGTTSHNTNEYALLNFYIPGTDGRIALVRREVHIVEELRAKVLMGVDIMGPEGIIMDMNKKMAVIYSCDGISVPLSVTTRSNQRLRRPVLSKEATTIPPRTVTMIPIRRHADLPEDRDFLFEPQYNDITKRLEQTGSIYAHVVDYNMTHVQVHNGSNDVFTIPTNTRLGILTEYDADGCYLVDSDRLAGASNYDGYNRRLDPIPLIRASTSNMVNADSMETKLANGVTVYGSKEDMEQLAKVVNEIPELWKDRGQAAVPQKDWMSIPLVDNWTEKYKPGVAKVYPVGPKDRAIIDEDFDKLHQQGRMTWSNDSTPFSFPCFVVWKTLADGTRKGRTVVDIRALNQISIPDAYPIPSQEEILASMKGATHISTIDAASFFYQWPVKPEHRHRLAVVSHRGQEIFNVAVMGYRNSPAYVQRRIDTILRGCRNYARAYVDDICIFSKSLKEHITHLREVFKTLNSYNIGLKPSKAFIGYPSVQLLGQRVDALGMTTAQDKLEAITALEFPKTLKALETYLGMTGYLRHYIPFYAQITEPLQNRKTSLNKSLRQRNISTEGGARKRAVAALSIIAPSPTELDAFHHLQTLFAHPKNLAHFDHTRQLYADVDASKEFGFGVMIYHSKTEKLPAPTSVEPILFLSRMLTIAESRYWPTELEVACLVWTIRKIRHMIEASDRPTIIYTDHAASLAIARQTSLTTSSTDKLNLRLIRASQYLQQFRLDVRHKAGKLHLVPDALSRLHARKDRATSDMSHSEEGILDSLTVHVYPAATIVEMDETFKERIQEGYEQDGRWKRIKNMILDNESLEDNAATLPFIVEDGLIYLEDSMDHSRRLCVPDSDGLIKEVFEMAHDEAGHPGYARTHERITQTIFIQRLSQRLHEYLRHCQHCRLNQTPRHKPYGALQPILSPPEPFYTITIDFVLALPISTPDKYDCLLTVTDKFTKRLGFIPGRETYKAKDWAISLLDHLMLADWGLPKVMISDRDPKFVSELWRTWFKYLNVRLLTSTSYHPQTDGQSERTNQTIEIAFRYYLSTLDDVKQWPYILPLLQSRLNNSATITGRSPNEVLYGFRLREALDLVLPLTLNNNPIPASDDSADDPEQIDELQAPYLQARVDAADAIALAAMEAKRYYDGRHKAAFMNKGDMAYLRLHKGYSVPGLKSRKINQQLLGPFRVKRRVGKLAYELELPNNWRIHPVISIAQLEPAPIGPDPYNRPRQELPIAVEVEGETDQYEIERLLDRRIRGGRHSKTRQYLVKWKGLGHEWNEWIGLKGLEHAMDLVRAYDDEHPEV